MEALFSSRARDIGNALARNGRGYDSEINFDSASACATCDGGDYNSRLRCITILHLRRNRSKADPLSLSPLLSYRASTRESRFDEKRLTRPVDIGAINRCWRYDGKQRIGRATSLLSPPLTPSPARTHTIHRASRRGALFRTLYTA